ncbi:hypothetical protein PH213_16255 [Streptomyces sp. SRF1]|uniref:hypothetical protein n=1 Tax=Streptomyces sp. SRF1 TaxID=1549642 RepID=UPI0025B072A0|nr:hypothetical protein [Streptomyces sp. SRF1]MDN3056072.1 hypothetical protein [Streptomyces sp. SRF1]
MSEFTNFIGSVSIEPPLNESEVLYLQRFSNTRRMARTSGPYSTVATGRLVVPDGDILDINEPPVGQPGLYCQWIPGESGASLEWSRRSKFPFAAEWMSYIIDQFLKPGAALADEMAAPMKNRYYAPEFQEFTFNHTLNGEVVGVGEFGERCRIIVSGNRVRAEEG